MIVQDLKGKRVLLTYGAIRTTYSALRNLSKSGATVYIADRGSVGMSQFSRFRKTPISHYPSHYSNPNGFVQSIKRICDIYKIELIIPSHDETELLARHRELFTSEQAALLPEFDACSNFNNKAKSYDIANECGLSTPRRFLYTKMSELKAELPMSKTANYVVKLRTGNSSKGVFHTIGTHHTIEVVSELVRRFNLSAERYPQVEEAVSGSGWGCSVLYWHGDQLLNFCHKRLREKISTGGTSTQRLSWPDKKIQEATEALMSHVNWHGLAMVEFKVDPDTGIAWFIEVNPRMWGSMPFAIASGAEFPRIAAIASFFGKEAALEESSNLRIKKGVIGRWLLGDLFGAMTHLGKMELGSGLSLLSPKGFDSHDDFYFDDLGAFVGEAAWYASRVLKARNTNPTESGMVR